MSGKIPGYCGIPAGLRYDHSGSVVIHSGGITLVTYDPVNDMYEIRDTADKDESHVQHMTSAEYAEWSKEHKVHTCDWLADDYDGD